MAEATTGEGPFGGRYGEGWVYVSEETARTHPLFGVYGWALLLLLALFVGPIVLIWQTASLWMNVYEIPAEIWMPLVADLCVLVLGWSAGIALAREEPSFQGRFHAVAAVSLCSCFLFGAVTHGRMPDEVAHVVWWGVVLRGVPPIAAWIYVMQSDRIAVTTKRRVRHDDPWLLEQWGIEEQEPETALGRLARRLGLTGRHHFPENHPEQPELPVEEREDSRAWYTSQYYTSGGGIEPRHFVEPRLDAHKGEPSIWDVEPDAETEWHWGEPLPLDEPSVGGGEPDAAVAEEIPEGTGPVEVYEVPRQVDPGRSAPPRPDEPPEPDTVAEDAAMRRAEEENVGRLRRLRRARDEGLISEEEYAAKRAEILSGM